MLKKTLNQDWDTKDKECERFEYSHPMTVLITWMVMDAEPLARF